MSNHTPRKRIPTAQQPIKIHAGRSSRFGLKTLVLGAAVVGLLTAACSWLDAVKVSGEWHRCRCRVLVRGERG